MNSGALGGLLKIAIAAGLALAWQRGYLSDTISKTVGAFTTLRTKVPFQVPGSHSPADILPGHSSGPAAAPHGSTTSLAG